MDFDTMVMEYIKSRTDMAEKHLLSGDKDTCMLLLDEVQDMCDSADSDKYLFFWCQYLREST
jgi:hypothetical protein